MGIGTGSYPGAVPAPAGILLAALGTALVGHLRGRKTL
jgi:hypothetical protein